MSAINLQKSTVSLGTLAKSGGNLTWDESAPMTWNEGSGTWDLPNIPTENISKSLVNITVITKST